MPLESGWSLQESRAMLVNNSATKLNYFVYNKQIILNKFLIFNIYKMLN